MTHRRHLPAAEALAAPVLSRANTTGITAAVHQRRRGSVVACEELM
jgi:hypothetical protein